MPLLHREMNGKSTKSMIIICSRVTEILSYRFKNLLTSLHLDTDELQKLAVEVGEILKDRLGEVAYSQKLAECQKEAASKYEARKRHDKELAVLDPAGAALKKQRKQARKVESRKRKLDELKPYRIAKRKRRLEASLRNEE